MRKLPLIAGNWKMNKSSGETTSFIKELAPHITDCDVMVYLAVPFTYISLASRASEKTGIVIGAQNMNDAKKGAFTGEVAGIMLKDSGAEFVILGHSERRHIFGEDNDFINKKVIRAIKDDIKPILCVGETEEERDGKRTEDVLKEQLEKGLSKVSKEDVKNVVIAYEPVWAIGTGKTATPQVANSAHQFIRKTISSIFGATPAKNIYIIYGGSVKGENIEDLLKQKDIDGALVGGASLEVESFLEIIRKS